MQPLDVAREAARAGGQIVMNYFHNGVTMRSKESYNLVSDADIESEQAIVRVIQDAFPDHAILGEESHRDSVDSDHLWIIDPLDGTNNFAHQVPHFAVSIGYYERGVAQCGVVYNPVRDDWYEAVQGQGAKHNGASIKVGSQSALNEVLVGVGFYYDRGTTMEATLDAIRELFREHIHGIRRFGTASLDLCQVASGLFGAFFEYELSPWDFAAGRLILEEAGGRITNCLGTDLPLAKSSVLASNWKLHSSMLEIVSRHFPQA